MDFISLANPISIKCLWENDKTRIHINKLLNAILNEKEEYQLQNFFHNDNDSNVRSYIIFETQKFIVFVDFNLNNNDTIMHDDLYIIDFIRYTTRKEVKYILFNNKERKNIYYENKYIIFRNDNNNNMIKLILAKNFKEQSKYDSKITDFLYSQNSTFKKLYYRERELLYKY